MMDVEAIKAMAIRYERAADAEAFWVRLRKRVRAYFEAKKLSPKANAGFWVKVGIGFAAWGTIYGVLISDVLRSLPTAGYYAGFIFLSMLLGFVNFFFALNLAHDGSHNAISTKKWINRLGCYTLDFCGGSGYLFRKMHDSHHYFANIIGIDPGCDTSGIYRNTPHVPFKPIHRFQHLYVPLLYCIATLHWVFVRDYQWMFFEKHIGTEKNIRHPAGEVVLMIGFKLLYYTMYIVLPILFLQAPGWVLLCGFLALHIPMSYLISVVFQAQQIFAGASYPLPNAAGKIENDYFRHSLETAQDFSRDNRLLAWFFGGLNYHNIHHFFPQYSHVHYKPLTEILVETCKEFDMPYHEAPTFSAAVRRHYADIRRFARPDGGMAGR